MFDYFIGIDVAKEKFNYAVINNELKVIAQGSCQMNESGFKEFKETLKNFNNSIVALESTGPYHINLLSFLSANDIKSALINPSLIKRFSNSISLRNTKTDSIDATIIAKFICKNIDNIDYFTAHNIEDITALARLREQIAQEIAKVKTSLKQHLAIVFPEFPIQFNPFTETALNILKNFPTPKNILSAGPEKIQAVIDDMKAKHTAQINPHSLVDLAKNSIGQSSDIWATVIKYDVEMLIFLNDKLEKISKEFIDKINKHKKDEMEIIKSIKGIGDNTAAHFLVEIRDIKRFENRNKLSAYAGIDPSIKQSGSSINSKGKISKKGSKSLRRTLYLMASGVMKFNDYFRAYYLKKRQEGMKHRKAMIALCNKLIRTLFALLSKKEMFNVNFAHKNL